MEGCFPDLESGDNNVKNNGSTMIPLATLQSEGTTHHERDVHEYARIVLRRKKPTLLTFTCASNLHTRLCDDACMKLYRACSSVIVFVLLDNDE